MSTGSFFVLSFSNLAGGRLPCQAECASNFLGLGTITVMKLSWLKLLTMLMLASICAAGAGTRQWAVLGPDGGDVRSLAYDPQDANRVFLGTSTGVIFVSEDSGHNWARFAKLGSGDDYVLDHIVFDPHNSKTIFVSAWSVQDQSAGDIFRTHNGGKDWDVLPAMHGKSDVPWRYQLPIPR
jgi:photosystem II stability/assembly factor-like uncharacterized protein